MTPAIDPIHPFQIAIDAPGPIRRQVLRLLRPSIESALAFPSLNREYARAKTLPGPFADRALATLGVDVAIPQTEIARIPATGPLIIVANHPFGGIDGLVLASLLQRARPDVKLLANYMLSMIPDMREQCFFVDPFGGPDAARRNLAGMKAAIHWVRDGGALAVFPAGEVSHLKLDSRLVLDPVWSDTVGRLIQRTGAHVLPVFFDGRNSALFQAAGLIHPRLRTAMLPREFLRHRSGKITARIGSVIAPDRLAQFETAAELVAYLRTRTYILRARITAEAGPRTGSPSRRRRVDEPIAPPQPEQLMAQEVAALGPARVMAQSGHISAIYAEADEIPSILQEIGRLREITFRLVGEATGRPADLDSFDRQYLHVFLWNSQTSEVVGAYRLGLTDRIMRQTGAAGLYTHSLFRYKQELLDQLGPSIELGRSFVRPEYQKEYAPLLLLWKGVARYMVANPRYKNLIGPVSISNDYSSLSKQLLVGFLRMNRYLPALGRLMSPKNPLRPAPDRQWQGSLPSAVVRDIADVDELVGEIESDRPGVPVLLRQYLKLNAKLLGFNVDPDFGDAIDALMLVDLSSVDARVLNRLMGADGAKSFLAFHGVSTDRTAQAPASPAEK